ncbi:hypothetical protein ACGF8E_38260 [Streptomyces tendae]|uniref:hypothetical protein n=1 Tax=Streptomyces tendae TaxID=1932 RepID=UPI00371C1272
MKSDQDAVAVEVTVAPAVWRNEMGAFMGLERLNCWTLAEVLGHSGPHRLRHFLSRAVWDDETVGTWVVDEAGDEKAWTDAVGAARQYSGALGGVGL